MLKGSCCLRQPWRHSLIQPSVPIICSPSRGQSSYSGMAHCLCVWKSLSCEPLLCIRSSNCFSVRWAPVHIPLLTWSFDLLVTHLPLLSASGKLSRPCLFWLLQSPCACSLLSPYKSISLTFWTSVGHPRGLCPCRPCADFGPCLFPELASLLSVWHVFLNLCVVQNRLVVCGSLYRYEGK